MTVGLLPAGLAFPPLSVAGWECPGTPEVDAIGVPVRLPDGTLLRRPCGHAYLIGEVPEFESTVVPVSWRRGETSQPVVCDVCGFEGLALRRARGLRAAWSDGLRWLGLPEAVRRDPWVSVPWWRPYGPWRFVWRHVRWTFRIRAWRRGACLGPRPVLFDVEGG